MRNIKGKLLCVVVKISLVYWDGIYVDIVILRFDMLILLFFEEMYILVFYFDFLLFSYIKKGWKLW